MTANNRLSEKKLGNYPILSVRDRKEVQEAIGGGFLIKS